MTIGPIEESFAMMNRYGLVYSSSDAERVDGLTYAWRKLHAQVCRYLSRWFKIKPDFLMHRTLQCCYSTFHNKITEMLRARL